MFVRLDEVARPKCPVMVYRIWKSGRHGILWADCGKWACLKCGKRKLHEIAENIASKTKPAPGMAASPLHQVTLPELCDGAIKRSLQRYENPSLRIRLRDGNFYVLAEREASGRDWSTEEIPWIDAISNLAKFDTDNIKRRDYTLSWKPEVNFETNGDKLIARVYVGNLERLRKKLKSVGEDLDSDVLVNGEHTAEKLKLTVDEDEE